MLTWLFKAISSIEKLLNKYENRIIFKTSISLYNNFFLNKEVSVYNCSRLGIPELKNAFSKMDKYKLYIDTHYIVLITSKKVLIILLNDHYSLGVVLEFLYKNNFDNIPISKLKSIKTIAEQEIIRIDSCNKNVINSIRNQYPHVTYFRSSLYFNETELIPDKCLKGDMMYTIKNAPVITKLQINLDPLFKINSVYGEGSHPNFSENYWCLGKFQGKLLTVEMVDAIFDTIKIYNLNDSFFIPETMEICEE